MKVLTLCTTCCVLVELVNGLTFNPPSEELFSNQLCPDPTTKKDDITNAIITSRNNVSNTQTLITPRKVTTINLDKSATGPKHFYESCSFKEQWDTGSATKGKGKHTVKVRSINLNVNSWNFSTASNCSAFIKFTTWDNYDGRFPILCGRENFDQFLGPYGHPMVLYYQWKHGGLSFPLFYSSYGDLNRDRKETTELAFMQIYFIVYSTSHKESYKRCRVQQYKIDWGRTGCASTLRYDEFDMCGEYPCEELEAMYKEKMTIFKDGENENDTVLVWKTKSDKYKMRTFLRQKFVPVVFLVVLVCAYRSYMKAGLRYQSSIQDDMPEFRVRSFRLRRPRHIPGGGRTYAHNNSGQHSAGDEPYWEDYDEEDPPPSYPNSRQQSRVPDPPIVRPAGASSNTVRDSSEANKVVEDPPPPYEFVCPPPSYTKVATDK